MFPDGSTNFGRVSRIPPTLHGHRNSSRGGVNYVGAKNVPNLGDTAGRGDRPIAFQKHFTIKTPLCLSINMHLANGRANNKGSKDVKSDQTMVR